MYFLPLLLTAKQFPAVPERLVGAANLGETERQQAASRHKGSERGALDRLLHARSGTSYILVVLSLTFRVACDTKSTSLFRHFTFSLSPPG